MRALTEECDQGQTLGLCLNVDKDKVRLVFNLLISATGCALWPLQQLIHGAQEDTDSLVAFYKRFGFHVSKLHVKDSRCKICHTSPNLDKELHLVRRNQTIDLRPRRR